MFTVCGYFNFSFQGNRCIWFWAECALLANLYTVANGEFTHDLHAYYGYKSIINFHMDKI